MGEAIRLTSEECATSVGTLGSITEDTSYPASRKLTLAPLSYAQGITHQETQLVTRRVVR
jgi:hypothetical protein